MNGCSGDGCVEVAGPLIGGAAVMMDDALLSCISDVIQLTVVTVCMTLQLPTIWRFVTAGCTVW